MPRQINITPGPIHYDEIEGAPPALDTTDFATSEQGATADQAVQPPEMIAAIDDAVAAVSHQPTGTIVEIPVQRPESSDATGAHSLVANANYIGGTVLVSTTQGAVIAWNTYLEAGSWKVHLVYTKTPDGGIITPSVDGVDLATIDSYESTIGYVTSLTLPAGNDVITIAQSSVTAIQFTSTTKNASSTGYAQRLSSVILERVANPVVGAGGGMNEPEIATSGAGQEMRLYRPPENTPSTATTLVVYMHGANGNAASMAGTSTHRVVGQAMLDEGWIVASSAMHGNNWGNQAALDDVADLIEWVDTTYNVTNVVLWGASMGALSAWKLLADGIDGVTILGAVGSSPVCDLRDMYDNRGWAGSIRGAFSIASDGSDYAAETAGFDPVLMDASVWAGKSMRAYQSPDDTTTPRAEHSAPLMAIAETTADDAVAVSTTGGHGDASNYPAAAIVAWINTL